MTAKHTPVTFDDVEVGDTLAFLTRDNGFGGSGGDYERTGVVTTKTEKTIIVRIEGGGIILGDTARIYRRTRFGNWNDRYVRRVTKEA